LALDGLTQSGTATPLDAETSRAQRLLHYHLPIEARVPFNKLTGATGPQNNKQIHGVVFVKDKGLSLSLVLLEGFGRHSNHLPQRVSVPQTSSLTSLIWGFHFDTVCFVWWQSFEDTRNAITVCTDFTDMSYVSIYILYSNLLRAIAEFNSTLLLYFPRAKFTNCTQNAHMFVCRRFSATSSLISSRPLSKHRKRVKKNILILILSWMTYCHFT
jgi:hypothetical protein